MVASALFGMSFAAVISLASIVLVDMFGLESLTASIGLLVLVKAIHDENIFQHLITYSLSFLVPSDYSQGRLSNSNQSAVLFLGAKCKLQLSSHSLLPHNAEWEGKRVCTHNAE